MGFETIIFDKIDGVARLRLNRPDRLNTFIVPLALSAIKRAIRARSNATRRWKGNWIRSVIFSGSFVLARPMPRA